MTLLQPSRTRTGHAWERAVLASQPLHPRSGPRSSVQRFPGLRPRLRPRTLLPVPPWHHPDLSLPVPQTLPGRKVARPRAAFRGLRSRWHLRSSGGFALGPGATDSQWPPGRGARGAPRPCRCPCDAGLSDLLSLSEGRPGRWGERPSCVRGLVVAVSPPGLRHSGSCLLFQSKTFGLLVDINV